MTRTLSVLAPTRYPWRFNGPRRSRHRIENRDFLPLNYVSPRIEGVTVLNPWPPRRFDLVHGFNRIPLGRVPFVIGFESHLPRAFGAEHGAWWRWMTRRLEHERCRAIVAISDFARRIFLARHPQAGALHRKLHVRLPNIVLPDSPDAVDARADGPIRLVFVGNHFARKGGCVAVRMAERAAARGIALELDVVSRLEMGGAIWTDPTGPDVFAPYLDLLRRPNVRLHKDLPNAQVMALLRRAHFSVLATLGDTFGYSVLESMAVYTPVIATAQGALPELVAPGAEGILLDLPVTAEGEWLHLGAPDRDTPRFARLWQEQVEALAEAALEQVLAALEDREHYAAMRRNARAAMARHDAEDANAYWDSLYDRAVAGVVEG